MKTRITLTDWTHGPGILATWNAGRESAVFDSLEHVQAYFIGLFWEPVFVDRRRSA